MNLLIVLDQEVVHDGVEEVIGYLKSKYTVQLVKTNCHDYIQILDNHQGLKILISNCEYLSNELARSLNDNKESWLVVNDCGKLPQKKFINQGVSFITLPPNPSSFLNTHDHHLLNLAISVLTWCVEKLKIKERSLKALSKKENEVVNLLLQGLDDREISKKLYISDKTVRNHVSNVLQKIGLKNRTQLVLWALQEIGQIKYIPSKRVR